MPHPQIPPFATSQPTPPRTVPRPCFGIAATGLWKVYRHSLPQAYLRRNRKKCFGFVPTGSNKSTYQQKYQQMRQDAHVLPETT